ncbi:MAG TPA: superinfection immunity protein [Trinickia sp.]|nr:superinfection immunity protein [Trinickia sp.]
MDAMRHVFESVALIGALIVYLVPAMEADVRNHDHALGITLVNVLLGWTIVGWFAALRAARNPSSEKRIARIAIRVRRATAHATVDKIVAHARNCAPFQRQSKEERHAVPGRCM